jgi:hypothetical protein
MQGDDDGDADIIVVEFNKEHAIACKSVQVC